LHAQVNAARRKVVKATVGKSKVSAKVQGKPKKAVVAAKPARNAVAKPAAKHVAKPLAKPAPKTPAKPAAKPAAKKPAAKVVAKPVARKPADKQGAAVKGAAKVPVKAPLKVAVNVKLKKPLPSVAPPKGKVPVKTIPPSAKPVVAAQPKAESVAASAKAAVVPPPAPVVMAASSAASAVPPKAGRPSSRLAQLTVPSMAQSVASTAAKASYTQTMSIPLIVPPLPSAAKKDPKLANNWKTKPVEQLTDAELLAMPDSEYMNETQMAVFRLKLSVLKQDILNSAGETTEHLREDTVVVPDPADRATIEEEHALELRTRDRERKLLKKIEQSINRIDAGDYGYCDETGEPIGVGRLLARPTATLSLEAQQRRELKQKMFGD
jgi:DnaK suppressor protein